MCVLCMCVGLFHVCVSVSVCVCGVSCVVCVWGVSCVCKCECMCVWCLVCFSVSGYLRRSICGCMLPISPFNAHHHSALMCCAVQTRD